MPVHECEKGGVAMQAKVGLSEQERGEKGRLFELGGLKLKGKSDCQIRFPLRRILRHSRRRRRQLETWTSFLSVRQSLSTARNAFLLILNPSRVTACTPRRGRLVAAALMISEKWSDPAVGPVTLCRQMSSRSMHCLYLDLFLWEIMGLKLE